MRTVISSLVLASVSLVSACASSSAEEPVAHDEASVVPSDVLAIEDVGSEATIHLTRPGRSHCGLRMQLSEQALVGWNFFMLPTFVEVLPADSLVELVFTPPGLTATLVNPRPAEDAWMTIRTRDGRSVADVIRATANIPPDEPLGTIAPMPCP